MTDIKTARNRLGMTQSQLAEKIGVERTVLSHWENGDNDPRTADLPRIADALGVSIDELVRGGDNMRGKHNEVLILAIRFARWGFTPRSRRRCNASVQMCVWRHIQS